MVRSVALTLLGCLLACGGKAVIDGPPGSGGAGGSTTVGTTTVSSTAATTGTATSATSSTASGAFPDCRIDGCATGWVCHQPTGTCLVGCVPGGETPCPDAFTCEPCASSSCPTCDDCVAACVPANGSRICAKHTDCPMTDWCVFSSGACSKKCGTGAPTDVCELGVCQQCYTSSCPTCEDCLSVCVGG
ncbi:MAG: hypothetical protein FJ096_12530 [Deltaproteobacteria bacterium]|nr:hypothetical protein [Deltaproteobacteria bacterium]